MRTVIGIDIGGTFVDIVISDASGLRFVKVPSSPDDPARSVLSGLRSLIGAGFIDPSRVERVIHGSTVATNALLEGSWGRTALVTTRGFRDVLEIGRQNRPHLLDPFYVRPEPIVPRHLRFEVDERLASDGEVLVDLDVEGLKRLLPSLMAASVDAVAIVFLFSFIDPRHEREARRILEADLDAPVVISSDVLPEFREFERTSTTVATAALRPIVGAYVTQLEAGASELGLPGTWQIMQSSGAVTSAEIAQLEPARVLLSGPAGGVEGARAIGALVGKRDLITMDMGGTSCDVALVRDGRIGWSTRGRVGDHPIALPMVEIHTIGAGGGSIAWIDVGGALRVGPASAGARPGPACYGRGGERPTVTDAHVVLGHLPPDRPIGGLASLDVRRAREAIETVGKPLGLSVEAAALGILQVSDAAMERAIRVISVERGQDPRECALVAFGGAGPLHAVVVARRLSIPNVIVPSCAGVLSAFGLLTADAGHDVSRSIVRPLDEIPVAEILSMVERLKASGRERLLAEGVREEQIRFRPSADLRYEGQSHEVNVPLPKERAGDAEMVEAVARAFHRTHEERFGHAADEEGIELVTLRVRAFSPSTIGEPTIAQADSIAEDRVGNAWFGPEGPVSVRLVDRRRLEAGDRLDGPAILFGSESTILVPPDATAGGDRFGNVLLEAR